MGRPKLAYCIEYRNMHTGIHGLLCYDTRKVAEQYLDDIKKFIAEEETEYYKSQRENRPADPSFREGVEFILDEAFNKADTVIEEINFRDIEWVEKNIRGKLKGQKKYGKDCVIINLVSLDLYL